MTGFTKGPWRVDDSVHGEEGGIVHIKSDGYSEMCTMFASALENEDEFLANANLIAAAPDLYETLDRLVNWIWSEHGMTDRVNDAVKALAKARGEET